MWRSLPKVSCGALKEHGTSNDSRFAKEVVSRSQPVGEEIQALFSITVNLRAENNRDL